MTEIEETKELEKINEIVNNMGNAKETLIAACKLLARLLYEEGKKYNATEIKFTVSDIYELKDYSRFNRNKMGFMRRSKMTEEIMIDGVDVAKCVFLNKTNGFKHCYCTNAKDTLGDERDTRYGGCEYNENCYYKQLKRLEQENAKLKKALKEIREMAIYDCERECSNDSEDCTIGSCLEKRIQRKINKVMKDDD